MKWLRNIIEALIPCKHEWEFQNGGVIMSEATRTPTGDYKQYLCKKCLKSKIVKWKV